MALARRQIALVRAADMRRGVAQRGFVILGRPDAVAVIAHDQNRPPALASTLDGDVTRIGVDRVLNQLGNGLARIGQERTLRDCDILVAFEPIKFERIVAHRMPRLPNVAAGE